jgi:hypothetical protein
VLDFIRRLLPPYAVQSARVTIYWRKGRIRRVRVEYGKLSLLRRLIQAVFQR